MPQVTFKQTELNDCADAFVATAKNSSITGQTIQIGRSIPWLVGSNPNILTDSGLLMLK